MKQGRFTAWQHQVEGCRAIVAARHRGERRSLLVMASGLGKTVTSGFDFSKFCRKHPDARFLFLAHQNDIVQQAEREFREMFDGSMQYGFFIGHKKDTKAQATFATLQSMDRAIFGKPKKRACPFRRGHFDYIIVDESHHGPAPTYKRVIEYFQPKFMLAITATPDRMDMANIRDMFGQEVYSLDLVEALAQGLLTKVDYRIMADEIVDRGKIKLPPHLISIQKLNRIFFSRKRDTEIVKVILDKADAVRDPRGIVFTASIKHAESFAKLLPGSMAIHSDLPRKERERRMGLIRSGIVRFAVTVDQFNEGIDIPEANILVFLRSTQSRTVFYQQLGRGLRKVRGKSSVLVLDFVANCERLMFLEQINREVQWMRQTVQKSKQRHETFNVNWGRVVFEERAREVLDFLKQAKRGLTKETLLQYIIDFHRRLGRAPSTLDLRTGMGMPSISPYMAQFGSFREALRLAHIPVSSMTHLQAAMLQRKEDKELLGLLYQFYATHGRAPYSSDLRYENGLPTLSVYLRRFEDFAAALRLAGIPDGALSRAQRAHLLKLNAQKLLGLLADFFKVHGRAPRGADFGKDLPSGPTYRKYFGSLYRAYELAGIPDTALSPLQQMIKKPPTKKRLLRTLKAFAITHGRLPNKRELGKGGMPSLAAYKKHFGGLAQACQVVHLPRQVWYPALHGGISRGLSDRQCLSLLKDFYRKHHRAPQSKDFGAKNGMPSESLYKARFGGILQACRMAGIPTKAFSASQLGVEKVQLRLGKSEKPPIKEKNRR